MFTTEQIVEMGVRLAAGVIANPACAAKINGPDTTAVLSDCIRIVGGVTSGMGLFNLPMTDTDERFDNTIPMPDAKK